MVPILEADRVRVAHLEAQISHLERSLSALREEKMLAQERLDSYKYPVLTLPNEIVSEIFMHFLPAYPEYPPLTGLLSPTLLTHICCRWREIALGTPALWSAITSSYHGYIPLKQKAHLFDLWLKRSRFCPLSLQIGGGMGIDEFLAVVVPHRARWEHLELEDTSLACLPIIDGPMPLLRHLNLSLYHSFTDAPEVFAFRDAPLLRTVVLSPDAASSVILPWAQLTSLTLFNVYPRVCVPILQQTSNLVRCELEVWFDSDNHEHGPDITLRYLESLTLVEAGNGPVIGFLETFIVPALRRLKIPEEFLGPSPIDSLTGFISKSDCKLAEVHIGSDPRSLREDSYRQAFPSIHKFSFDYEEESSNSDSSDLEDNSDSE
ncbi:hypothetical protein B0H13DRAFT_2678693 [Mycena leptocephala]|nr:hypothetical protein B0H13DRAFT_2678693 [Mycena leptocephala]